MIILIWLGGLVIGLVFLARLGFSFTPKLTVPTLHWWGHPMRNSLKAYLAKQIPNTDFMIHYHIGGGLMGETDLRLRGDGSYELWTTATKGRKRMSYSGQLDTFQVDSVVQDMLATRVWQVKHIHPHRRLDDPDAMIAVEAGDQKSKVVLWVSEVRKSPPFQKVQAQLQGLIRQISVGKELENGRGTNAPQVEQGGRFTRNFNFLPFFLRELRSQRIKSRSILLKSDLRQREETTER